MKIKIIKTFEFPVNNNIEVFQKNEIYDISILEDNGSTVTIKLEDGTSLENFPKNYYIPLDLRNYLCHTVSIKRTTRPFVTT